MKRHKETVQHVNVNEAENHCASCNKTFKLTRHLNMHLKTAIHLKNNPENIVNSIINDIIDNIGTPNKYTCDIC